jgi:formylglycine-generating enzyme required for sulfatase activity
MVRVSSAQGVAYCIDSTEVTQAQYAAFVKASEGVKVGSEHPACSLNLYSGYTPHVGEGGCANEAFYTPETTPDASVGCVDWCDAFAYCKWAGKRLCGRVGGGAVKEGQENDAGESQWYNACSQGGKTKFPYGDTYDGSRCSGKDAVKGSTEEEKLAYLAKAGKDCHGSVSPFDQLLDLSGNRGELEDACQGEGPTDGCRVRGGAYGTGEEGLSCATAEGFFSRTGDYSPQIGFRCCLDL